MRKITVPLKDRQWWVLPLMTSNQRKVTVIKLVRCRWISDWQLWDVLGLYNSPVSWAEATEVYVNLDFVPHVGYPLRKEKHCGIAQNISQD